MCGLDSKGMRVASDRNVPLRQRHQRWNTILHQRHQRWNTIINDDLQGPVEWVQEDSEVWYEQ